MKRYRLTIWQHQRRFGTFETDVPGGQGVLATLLAHLPEEAGFHCEAEVATEERRIVETGPHGVHVLAIHPAFETLSLPRAAR